GLPPIPTAKSSPGPAALAAGAWPGANSLVMDGSGAANNTIIPASANPATLRPLVQPVPRESAPNGLSVVPAAAPAWAAPAPADPDAGIRKQLEAHGVVSSKLDTLPDGVRLTVMVPKGNDATRFLE